jgi:hypothetical protein
MIIISIPNNNIPERKYILYLFFNEFLGLDYQIVENIDFESWGIELENGSRLIIEDHFFNKYPTELNYLKLENIPSKVEYVENKFTPEDDIPIIYGNSKLKIQDKKIICGNDIFASSYFMLTRWEEYVNKNRDSHDRFPAYESLAYKQGFLDRPIVNEYIDILKKMLLELDNRLVFKEHKYQLYLTHDVDELYQWKTWKQILRVALGDVIKRRSLSLAIERFAEYLLIIKKKKKDPFDTFDWLMDKSESIGLKSRFYFMSGGTNRKYDNRYNIAEPRSLKLLKNIKKRRHIIGFHPSYNAYNDFTQFKKEKELLENIVGQKVVEGREHFLRFEIPITWQIWEDNDMEVDSTCGYADHEGFRCGTGNEFSVFNILTRKKLCLKERPLVYMDATIFNYQQYSNLEIESLLKKILDNNTKTVLWHNSSKNNLHFYSNLILKYRLK